SCGSHLTVSRRDAAGGTGPAQAGTVLSERARRFLAGLLAFSPELTLLHAPLPNSYRRLQPGGWAPSAATWGYDNRAAMVRVVGSGPSLRMEFRLPGADANPYLAIAALLAAGIGGVEGGGGRLPPPRGAAAAEPPPDPTAAIRRVGGSKRARRPVG